MTARALLALACLSVSSPALAAVSLGLEVTVGAQLLGLDRGPVARSPQATTGDLGGTLLLRAGPVAIGAAAEGTFARASLERFDASLLAGLVGDVLPALRLEVLGEVGAADLRSSSDLGAAARGGWDRFYGVRPGVSLKLPFFPLRVGAWGLARWGLPGTSGPALGLLGRVGLEF